MLLRGLCVLFIQLVCTLPALAADQPSAPYSLTISGGASLGVYEAGLNWVAVETLRQRNLQAADHYRLQSVTGSSAGAINALMSAMRYCMAPGHDDEWQAGNNLFYRTWNQSLDHFLSGREEDYDQMKLEDLPGGADVLTDSLFARKPFNRTVRQLKDYATQPLYRAGCRLQIGMVLTRTTPLNIRVPVAPREQNVQMQRFIVPVELSVEDGRLQLRNSRLPVTRERDFEYLLLPEDDAGLLSMEQVIRVAMASSAFPVAFGRVHLHYCFSQRYARDGGSNGRCPPGYRQQEGFFIDGGVYDNIPLGTAVDLSLQPGEREEHDRGNYLFIDPHQTRTAASGSLLNPQLNMPGQASADSGGYTLTAQLKALMPVFYGLRKQELNRTLLNKFNTHANGDGRRLLVSLRYPPLTGYYLHYFGAFADRDFRAYDYAAGIYDGLMNTVQYLCAEQPEQQDTDAWHPDCTVRAEALVAISRSLLGEKEDKTCAASEYLCYMLRAFALEELGIAAHGNAPFNAYFPAGMPHDMSGYLILATFRSLSEQADQIIGASMDVFMAELTVQKALCVAQGRCEALDQPLSELLQESRVSLLDRPQDFEQWSRERLRRASMRLLVMEEQQEGKMVTPLRLAALASNLYRDGSKNVWATTSVPEAPFWYRFLPDQAGLDAAQTGLFLSWMPSPSFWVFDSSQLETEISLHRRMWGSYNDEPQSYYKLQIGYRPSFEHVIYSSFGIHLNINENLDHRVDGSGGVLGDANRYLGWEVSTGLLGDKIRLSLGQRSIAGMPERPDANWTFRVAVTDLESFFYLGGLR